MIFKREIKEGKCNLKNDLMVTHRYENYDPYGYRGDNYYSEEEEEYDGGEMENVMKQEEKYFKHKIYQCIIAITNVSPKTR